MFSRHMVTIAGRFLINWLILDWRFYWAVFSGLRKLPFILRKRRETRRTMTRSDAELRCLLEDFYRSAPIELRRS